ncbi:hypothetical protein [Puniceicoccus vermicola]|uniref:Uncharacterized protein n=1 Tax=Puniceicoccus vermicola TaxID=388746 RepID=A0A7X1E4X4_9BACT|nr:hypothetical protein [Puniceicoccus vermicola]MBC2603005.1 hypothetical protein [Puniceicoccus vermicola]
MHQRRTIQAIFSWGHTRLTIFSICALGGSHAFAVLPMSSGQNTASGGIIGAADNPSPVTNSLDITGSYAAGNQGDNTDGSWSANAGGTFAYRGVSLSSETTVNSFNENAEVSARGLIDYSSMDVLTFDAVETFTLTFQINGSVSVGFAGTSTSFPGANTASYAGTVIVKNPDSGPDTFNNIYGGTTIGSTSVSANGANPTDSESNIFTATINPGQGFIFFQNADIDTGQTADANGVGTSGEYGTSTGYANGGIDLLSFKIDGIDTSEIHVFSQSGENYFAPVPEPATTAFIFAMAALASCGLRQRRKE